MSCGRPHPQQETEAGGIVRSESRYLGLCVTDESAFIYARHDEVFRPPKAWFDQRGTFSAWSDQRGPFGVEPIEVESGRSWDVSSAESGSATGSATRCALSASTTDPTRTVERNSLRHTSRDGRTWDRTSLLAGVIADQVKVLAETATILRGFRPLRRKRDLVAADRDSPPPGERLAPHLFVRGDAHPHGYTSRRRK